MNIDDPMYTEILLQKYELEFENQMAIIQIEFEKLLIPHGFTQKQKTGNSNIFILSYENKTHQIALFQFTENRDVVFDIFLGKKNSILDTYTLNESTFGYIHGWICTRYAAYVRQINFNLVNYPELRAAQKTRYLDTFLPRIEWLKKHYDVMVAELENPSPLPH